MVGESTYAASRKVHQAGLAFLLVSLATLVPVGAYRGWHGEGISGLLAGPGAAGCALGIIGACALSIAGAGVLVLGVSPTRARRDRLYVGAGAAVIILSFWVVDAHLVGIAHSLLTFIIILSSALGVIVAFLVRRIGT